MSEGEGAAQGPLPFKAKRSFEKALPAKSALFRAFEPYRPSRLKFRTRDRENNRFCGLILGTPSQ